MSTNGVPPRGDVVQLPTAGFAPIGVALGLTLVIVGLFAHLLVPGYVYSILGGLILLRSLVAWVGQVKRDVARLPQG
jgi:hypothetical protein